MFGISDGILLWILTLVIFAMFIMGSPVFLCAAYWSIGASLITGFTLENIGITCYQSISSYALLAMPLFILTGDLIGEAGVAKKLSNFSKFLVCRIRGGMALAVQISTTVFSAVSGSNSATVATIGKIMIPEMEAEGYPRSYAATTTAAGGITGIMVPPSILMIVYAFSANVSVMDMFMGGIIPGIVMTLWLMVASYTTSAKHKWGIIRPFNLKVTLRALLEAHYGVWAIALILIIIYNGIASPTEAAGIVSAYSFLIGLFATRGIKFKKIPAVFLSSGRVCGMLTPVVAVSVLLQQNFSIIGVQKMIEVFLLSLGNKWVILGTIMLIIIFLGSIMESIFITIILAPIMAPIALYLGFDPTHFGIIFLTGLCIGFITPPFGLDLFVASGITGEPYWKLIKWLPRYLLVLYIHWVIIALFPLMTLITVKSPF